MEPVFREAAVLKDKGGDGSVWDTDRVKMLLAQSLGSPVHLTKDEAAEIVRLAFGHRPDLPKGEEFVREVRPHLGYAVAKRAGNSG